MTIPLHTAFSCVIVLVFTVHENTPLPFPFAELVVASWAVVVQWVGLALQAVLWLGTLSADVMVMSSRLSLHLMTVVWARLKETWAWLMLNGRYYWTKWINCFWNSDKEHIRMSGERV